MINSFDDYIQMQDYDVAIDENSVPEQSYDEREFFENDDVFMIPEKEREQLKVELAIHKAFKTPIKDVDFQNEDSSCKNLYTIINNEVDTKNTSGNSKPSKENNNDNKNFCSETDKKILDIFEYPEFKNEKISEKPKIGLINILNNIYNKRKEQQIFQENSELYNLVNQYDKLPIFQLLSEKNKRLNSFDNILKKIKERFFKYLIINLNQKLSQNSIIKEFRNLEHSEISDPGKKKNKFFFEKTLKEILLEKPTYKETAKIDYINSCWENNKDLLEYLENSGNNYFCNIFNLNMKELYYDYLCSKDFEDSIHELQEGNIKDKIKKIYYFDYIQNYIKIAFDLVNYYN